MRAGAQCSVHVLTQALCHSFRVMFESGTLIAGTHFSAFRLIFLTSTFSTVHSRVLAPPAGSIAHALAVGSSS